MDDTILAAERPVKRRISGDARRTRFLDAAAEIIVEQGIGAVTMDGVAARTGVDKRLGYRYFTNRDAMLDALLQREITKITERTDARLPPNPTYEQRLRESTVVWLTSFVEAGPLMHRLVYDWHPVGVGSRTVRRKALDEWVEAMVASFDVTVVEAEISARAMLSALRGAVEALEDNVAPVGQIIDIYCAIALGALHAVARKR